VRTTSQRGVCMVATAHGADLHTLLSNPELSPLLGGKQAVTLGDEAARKTNGGHKSRTERLGPPTFTSAVEVLAVDRWVGASAEGGIACCPLLVWFCRLGWMTVQ
jgi:stage III sporulation protein SpoIIIAA